MKRLWLSYPGEKQHGKENFSVTTAGHLSSLAVFLFLQHKIFQTLLLKLPVMY